MEAREAFALLWSRINNNRSMSPDIEIGVVRREMVAILMEGMIGDEKERWVSAQLQLQSRRASDLQFSWADRQVSVLPPFDYNASEEAWDARNDQEALISKEALTEMSALLTTLIQTGRVLERDGYLHLP